MTRAPQEPVLIGWTEYVDLPDWGVKRLRVKIDTGARSSALHVDNLVELPRGYVAFDVVVHREKRDRHIHVKAAILRRGRVRSSNGQMTTRFFVSTRLRLGPVEKEVELSLVNRERMIHRMLLGRTALSGPFLIDADRRMVQSARKKKRKKKRKKIRKKKSVREGVEQA